MKELRLLQDAIIYGYWSRRSTGGNVGSVYDTKIEYKHNIGDEHIKLILLSVSDY